MKTIASQHRLSPPLAFLKSLRLADLAPENCDSHLPRAVAMVAHRFGACDIFLFARDDKGALTRLASIPGTDLTASEALIESVGKSGKPRLVEDAMNAADFVGDPAFQTFNISWAYCAPLKAGSRTMGFLYLDSRTARKWRPAELDVLGMVADNLALALQGLDMQLRLKNDERLITAGTAALHCSHSLKNLLQLIGGAAEVIDLALQRKEMPRVLRSWDIMLPNLNRLRRLTLDMLYYSKDRPLELAECDLNVVVLSVAESLKLQLREKHISLRTSFDKAVPALQLDGGRIHELVANLILNAADIVAENTGLISISTKVDRCSHSVRITISNNGPQMTAEQAANAFVPFSSTKQRFGTGLGLAIAKRIADQHGATITIKSSPKSTAFTLSLPAASQKAE